MIQNLKLKEVDGKLVWSPPVAHQHTDNHQSDTIFIPYIFEHVEDSDSRKEYNEFMSEYNKNHSRCPKCGSRSYRVTLVAYILNMKKKEEYRDRNRVTCDCGNVCTVHDLKPL